MVTSDAVTQSEDVQTVVSVRDVTKRYGPAVAVDSVSLEIRSGEFLSLLGPSTRRASSPRPTRRLVRSSTPAGSR